MRFFRLRTDHCPDPVEWDVFLCGRLAEAADREVRDHLEHCPSCQLRLKSTACDDLSLELHGLATDDPYIHEPECAQLRDLAMTVALPEGAVGPLTGANSDALPLPPEYEYLGKIAAGGMGVVVKARQLRLQRIVAVKTVRVERGGRDDLTRFQAEAVKLARLQHPNIVPIYEAGEVGGRPYFAMEFVDGGNLLAWVRTNLPPPRRAAALVRDVALAIAYAHSMGVIHRDLKPGNILMTRNGEPKVTDFGLAKYLDADQQSTAPDLLAGTAPYMAPEQVRGTAGKVGPGVDVYGLGAILYELLAGKPPHHGQSRTETLRLVTQGNPVAPSRERAGIPRDLEAICLKCLRSDPADRYPSAAAVVEDLQKFINGEPVRVRPVSQAIRAARWLQRHRAFSAVGLVAVLGALGGWEVRSYLRGPEAVSALGPPVDPVGVADHDLEDAIRQCERGRPVAGLLLLARALDALPAGETARRANTQANLAAWASQVCRQLDRIDQGKATTAFGLSPDGRFLLAGDTTGRIIVHDISSGSAARVLTAGRASEITALALSQDGNRVIAGSRDGTARIWELKSDTLLRTFAFDREVRAVALTPDGVTAVIGTAGTSNALTAWDVLNGEPLAAPPAVPDVSDLVVGKNGAFFVATGDGSTAQLWRSATDHVALTASPGRIRGAAIHPGGELLATGGDAIRLWDTRSGRLLSEWREPFGALLIERLTFSADGRTLLVRTTSSELRAWNLDRPGPLPLSLPRLDGIRAVASVPNRPEFITGSTNGVIRRIALPASYQDQIPFDPAWNFRQVQTSPGSAYGVVVLNPGLKATVEERCETRVALLDLRNELRVTEPLRHPDSRPASVAALDPTGHTLAVGYRTGDVLLWSTETQKFLTSHYEGHNREVNILAFDPSGRWLLSVSLDGVARLVDRQSFAPPVAVQHRSLISSAAISPLGDCFATGGADGILAVWRSADGHCLRQFNLGEQVQVLAYTPDGKTLLALGRGKGAKAWDLPSGHERGPVGPEAEANGLTVAPNGFVAVYGPNGITIQGPDQGERTPTITLQDVGTITTAAFDPTGTILLTGSKDHTARLWSVATGQQLGPALQHPTHVSQAVWGSADGTVLTSAGSIVRRWKVLVPPPAFPATDWVQSWTGHELNPRNEVVELSPDRWHQIRTQTK